MKKRWLIRFLVVGAGLATAPLCLFVLFSLVVDRPGLPPSAMLPADASVPEPGYAPHINVTVTLPIEGPAWSVVPLGGDVPTFRVDVVAPSLEYRSHPDGQSLHLAGEAGPRPGGAPDLPVLARVDEGHAGRTARAEVKASSFVEITGVNVAPVESRRREFIVGEEPVVRTTRDPDPEIYDRDAFWPPRLAEVQEVWMGTQKLVRTALHPVQYNPVTETVRYYESLSVTLVFDEDEATPASAMAAASEEAMSIDPFECPPLYGDPVLPPMNGNAADFAVRRAGAEVDAIYKIRVSEDGIYKVTQPELVAAGMSASDLVGNSLRLYGRDREIAIHTSAEGLMGAGDYLLFFGQGYDGRYTAENVYWLGTGGTGLRMGTVNGAPVTGISTVTTHYAVATYAPNTFFTDGVGPLNEEWDHWGAKELLTIPGNIVKYLDYDLILNDPESGMDAKVCVSLHGIAQTVGADPGHNTSVDLNGVTNVTFSWSGTGVLTGSPFQGAQIISSSALQDGPNDLIAWQRIVGSQGDQIYVESISLLYPRRLIALSDALLFAGEAGTNNYYVDGLTTNTDLWLLDVTDAAEPVRVTVTDTSSTTNGYRVLFGGASPATPEYLIAADTEFKPVIAIEKTMIRGLGDSDQQADYIVICPSGFREQVYRLLTNRYAKGQSIVVAPVEDIFNEFSYGVVDMAAVRQFLGYAFHHWNGPPPRHVLLVGDATQDPRGYLGGSVHEVLPAYFGGTVDTYAALDVWFTLVNGDDILSDMVLGRIPVNNIAALEDVVDKIIAYESRPASAPFRKRGLIVQDQGINFDFPADEVYAIMNTNGFTSINRQTAGSGGSNSGILDAINIGEGRFAAAYFGHGLHFAWDKEPVLLDTSDMPLLINTNLPIITASTCINGYFVNSTSDKEGLAESLLERANYGAIATIAGGALSGEAAANKIAVGFFDGALNQGKVRLGDAMLEAYLQTFTAFSTAPELMIYQIYGDPGLIINP